MEKEEQIIRAHLAAMTYLFLSAMGASHQEAAEAATLVRAAHEVPLKAALPQHTNEPQEDEPSPSST